MKEKKTYSQLTKRDREYVDKMAFLGITGFIIGILVMYKYLKGDFWSFDLGEYEKYDCESFLIISLFVSLAYSVVAAAFVINAQIPPKE